MQPAHLNMDDGNSPNSHRGDAGWECVVSTDKRSGITDNPSHPDEPESIVRLLGQVVPVSLETVEVVKSFALLNRQ